jgi:pimeloyl-ACP methyl ester carboxylesterase
MADYDLRADLARIEAPALVLGGRHDFIMPPASTAEPLAAGLPHAELVVFEDSGHFPYIEQAAHFGDVVRSWLGRLEEQR